MSRSDAKQRHSNSVSPVQPLILTLAMDPEAFARLQTLRDRHFPPPLNIVPAHLTLFHKLPGDRLTDIDSDLKDIGGSYTVLGLQAARPRFLGRGVAIEIEGLELNALRARLVERWSNHLTAQDRQGFRPHVTIQNKAEPTAAKALFKHFEASFDPFPIEGRGLLLWRYLGGPWEKLRFLPFAAG